MDVKSRYHLVGIAGNGEYSTALMVIEAIKSRSDEIPPIFVTDGLKNYVRAIINVYTCSRGRFIAKKLQEGFAHAGSQQDIQFQTADLWHLRVIKHSEELIEKPPGYLELQLRNNGQIVDLKQLESFSEPVITSTSYIERRQLTQRRHSAVLQRKSLSVPWDQEYLQDQVTLERFSYNFCQSHRSLRIYRPSGKKRWKKVTPAMKLALTDRIWNFQEALTFSFKRRPVQEKRSRTPIETPLPEPAIIELEIKDYIDWNILNTLNLAREKGLSRSELCKWIKIPRTTVYDRLCILEAKTLVTKSYSKVKKYGRSRTTFHCGWPSISLSHSTRGGIRVLVSNTN